MAFTIRGEKAEWKLIYDRIATLSVGDVVTYEELTAALGRDFEASRGPYYKANDTLLRERNLGLENVPGVGYRVVRPNQHVERAGHHHKRARKQLRKSLTWAQHTQRHLLTPDERVRLERVELTLSRQVDFTRRLDGRVARVEQALQTTSTKLETHVESTEDRLAKLEKLEKDLRERGLL